MGGISWAGGARDTKLSTAIATIDKGMKDGTPAALGFNVDADVDLERFPK